MRLSPARCPAPGLLFSWADYWKEVDAVRQRRRVVVRESFVYNPRMVDLGMRLWVRALVEALFRREVSANGEEPAPAPAAKSRAAGAGE